MSAQMAETFENTAILADILAQEHRTLLQKAQQRFYHSSE